MSELKELRLQTQKLIDRQFGNQLKFSKFAGISQGSLSLFLSGTRGLSGGAVEKLWKIIKENNAIHSELEIPKNIENDKNIEELNVYEIAGAGGSWALDSNEPVIKVHVPISYFKQAEFAFLVEGDSMHPTIKNGAVIGINSTLPFHPNEIYALRLHEGIVVKRVSVNQMNNTYIIRSDNTDKNYYPDYEVPIVEHENIFIGRVVWVMQNL